MKTLRNIATALLCLVITTTNAQQKNQKPDMEKMKADKVAYISTQLNLSVDEAQKFWPVYNEFEKKNDELFEAERSINRELKTGKTALSDSELTKKLDRMMEIQKEKTAIQSEYYEKFKKILPIQKVAKLYEAERGFRKQLLHEYGRGCGKAPGGLDGE